MIALRTLAVALAALALDPCTGVGNGLDSGTTSSSPASDGDAAGAPVVDDVTVPSSATIDISTGVAHVVGSISFHAEATEVTAVNVLVHGTGASVYRGAVGGPSPQPLVFDLSAPGAQVLDFNVQDSAGRTSPRVTKTIVVSQ